MQTPTRNAPPAYTQDRRHHDVIDMPSERPRHDPLTYVVKETPMSDEQLKQLRALAGV